MINLNEALTYLNDDKLIIYPTDTVYGIGGLATSEKAIADLLKIKPRTTGFIIAIDSWEKYADWIDGEFSIENSSRPTTWILPAGKQVPKALCQNGEIAIRKISHPPTKALLSKLNSPLISTSANRPGEPTPKTPEELSKIFDHPVLSGDTGNQPPSKIVHYTSGKIIRP